MVVISAEDRDYLRIEIAKTHERSTNPDDWSPAEVALLDSIIDKGLARPELAAELKQIDEDHKTRHAAIESAEFKKAYYRGFDTGFTSGWWMGIKRGWWLGVACAGIVVALAWGIARTIQ